MPKEKQQEILEANQSKTQGHGSWRRKKEDGNKAKTLSLTPSTQAGREVDGFRNTKMMYSVY